MKNGLIKYELHAFSMLYHLRHLRHLRISLL